jgi:hypothetical protein
LGALGAILAVIGARIFESRAFSQGVKMSKIAFSKQPNIEGKSGPKSVQFYLTLLKI